MNNYNHVFETPDFRFMEVGKKTNIDIGDLLYLEGNKVKPAGEFDLHENPTQTQNAFARVFAGVALQASKRGDDHEVKVGISGIYEFQCEKQSFGIGASVAPFVYRGYGRLENNKVEAAHVTYVDCVLGIGSVYRLTKNQSAVFVDIHSAICPRGMTRGMYAKLIDLASL